MISIDANGKRLGRLASEIAVILNGKDTVAYAANQAPKVKVSVKNAARMRIDEKKSMLPA